LVHVVIICGDEPIHGAQRKDFCSRFPDLLLTSQELHETGPALHVDNDTVANESE
jgi:hypothetical protein